MGYTSLDIHLLLQLCQLSSAMVLLFHFSVMQHSSSCISFIQWYLYQWTLVRSDGTCTSGYLSDPMVRVPVDTYPIRWYVYQWTLIRWHVYQWTLIRWHVYQWTLIRSDGTYTSGHLSDGTCTSGWLSEAPSVPPIVVQYVVCGMYIKLSIHCMPFHPIYTK